jgi:hypothetical protein
VRRSGFATAVMLTVIDLLLAGAALGRGAAKQGGG